MAGGACTPSEPAGRDAPQGGAHAAAREAMVRQQIDARGARDPAVLAAMRAVPRHELVAADVRAQAYEDRARRRSATARPSASRPSSRS